MPESNPQSKTPWEQASEWFARTIAIVLVMVAPGAFGAWLDGRLGTNFFAVMGFMLGMVLAVVLLMIFVRIKPIHNDGNIMKSPPRSPSTLGALEDSPKPQVGQKPSETRLPNLPGAEVLDSRHDE